jgi:hypothetical protein
MRSSASFSRFSVVVALTDTKDVLNETNGGDQVILKNLAVPVSDFCGYSAAIELDELVRENRAASPAMF